MFLPLLKGCFVIETWSCMNHVLTNLAVGKAIKERMEQQLHAYTTWRL